MPAGSTKRKSKPFKIETGEPNIDVVPPSKQKLHDEKASVVLRHFDKKFECFSSWPARDLKSFTRFIEKMNSKTQAQVTTDTDFCHSHKGKQKALPKSLSPEQKVFSLDVTGAGRAHGVFSDGKFFLVWLDRKGKILGH
ncbi:hypothetical protein [uncultured Ruegeria sp.]|uniref:hypothetical protein n=1 Tax=uncultured Ruegeria sp. TaxID=259304 RepID=UPI0026256420|nr:hypothetical protein [uncultured Ruegeria sp.]